MRAITVARGQPVLPLSVERLGSEHQYPAGHRDGDYLKGSSQISGDSTFGTILGDENDGPAQPLVLLLDPAILFLQPA